MGGENLNHNPEILIVKKIIQKELLNELYKKGLIDFVNMNNILKKLDEDISKQKELQTPNQALKNIIIDIPI